MTCESTWTLASSQATNWPFIQIFSLLVIAMAAPSAVAARSRPPALADRLAHGRRDASRVPAKPPPAFLIRLERGAERIEYRKLGLARRRPLAQQVQLLLRYAPRLHGRAVGGAHHEHEIRRPRQLGRQRARAVAGEVVALASRDAHRTLARRLPGDGRRARRHQLHLLRIAPELRAQRRHRERAATGVAGADEQDPERRGSGRHAGRG